MRRLAALLGLAGLVACGVDFAPKNAISTIRILATRADKPYAAPGETVNLEVLAFDGRTDPAKKPMRVFWFPAPCVNPPGGQYFACYAAVHQFFPVKTDLTPLLVENAKTAITIPANALDGAVVGPGQNGDRTVTAYNFVAACAGHLERVPYRSNQAINQLPVGCFDDATGEELGPDDFVLAYTRVFVFDQRKNAIPTLDGVVFQGQPFDPAVGITTARCKKKSDGSCPLVKLDVRFDDGISEVDPDIVDANGNVQRETIYVDWFTSVGKFSTNRKIVFDGSLGRPPKGSEVDYEPPEEPAKGTMWAVLHDNRGGTVWQQWPLDVQ